MNLPFRPCMAEMVVLVLMLQVGRCKQEEAHGQDTCPCERLSLHSLRIGSPPDMSVVSGSFREDPNAAVLVLFHNEMHTNAFRAILNQLL
jgi:hypothetical protein